MLFTTHAHSSPNTSRMCQLLSNICMVEVAMYAFVEHIKIHIRSSGVASHTDRTTLLCCSMFVSNDMFYIHFIGNCCAHKTLFDTFSISWCVPLLFRSFVSIFIYFRQPFGAGGMRGGCDGENFSRHLTRLSAMFFPHIMILFSYISKFFFSVVVYLVNILFIFPIIRIFRRCCWFAVLWIGSLSVIREIKYEFAATWSTHKQSSSKVNVFACCWQISIWSQSVFCTSHQSVCPDQQIPCEMPTLIWRSLCDVFFPLALILFRFSCVFHFIFGKGHL